MRTFRYARCSGFSSGSPTSSTRREIEVALRENGFDDVHPAAANVFTFVPPDGITVSELADLARVRKQTMAQAVDQLERTGIRRAPPEPA